MQLPDLAERLVAAEARERPALLAGADGLSGAALARALKARYVDAISGDPPVAARAAEALRDLAAITPDEEVRALSEWTLGMAALQIEGRADDALPLLDAAADRFRAIGQPAAAAATEVSVVYALAMLGRYDDAIRVGAAAGAVLLAHDDRLAAGKIEQNLGNIYHRLDRYGEAERHYRAARELFAACDDRRMQAFAANGLANVLALQHRAAEAAELYQQAIRDADAVGATVTQAEIECNLGCLALFQGRYDEALSLLERSRQHYAALKMPHQLALSELELADAYLELNLADDAAAIYERIVPQLAKQGLQAEQARALANHGRACMVLGDMRAAGALLAHARAIYEAEGNRVGAALTLLSVAQVYRAEGKLAQVLQLTAQIEATMLKVGAWGHLLLARWLRGEALRALQRLGEARTLLADGLQEASERGLPQLERRFCVSLGILAAADGDPAGAAAWFERAIGLIEAQRAPLPAAELRAAFVADKLAPYDELVRLHLAARDQIGALRFAERAKARALLELLRGAPSETAPGTPAEAELVARSAAARSELNWYYSQINRLAEGDTPPDQAAFAALQAATREREDLLRSLDRQIELAVGHAPGDVGQLNLPALQAALGPDTVLVEYFSLGGELLAFVVNADGVAVVRGLASEAEVANLLNRLRFQLGSLRHGGRSRLDHRTQLVERARHYLRALFRGLVAPIERHIQGKGLVIVPHRALHYVPFHALHDGAAYLVERAEISYAPSGQIFHHLAARPRRPLRHALLAGVPDARAPRLGSEAAALGALFPGATILLGEHATLDAVQAHAPAADLIHLACHGQFRPDNPLFSALRLADGNLTVRDAYQLKLRCELAVLSACETGVSLVAPGDEIFGFTRGFFAAGVPSLMVSLWPVDDEATVDLMADIYRRLIAGERPAAALRAAQIAAMQRHPHPFFWAPFVLIGRP